MRAFTAKWLARVVLFPVVLWSFAAVAQECNGPGSAEIQLSGDGGTIFPARFAAIFEDTGGGLEFDEILAADASGRFKRHCRADLSPPIEGGSLWVRFDVARAKGAPGNWVLTTASLQIDEVRVYQIQRDGLFVLKRTGRAVPADSRDMVSRWPAVGIFPEEGRSTRIYMRLSGVTTPFTSVELLDAKQFADREAIDLLTVAAIIGFLVAMLAYNIVIYVRSRLHQCILYFGYLGFILLHIIFYDGLVYRFVDIRMTGLFADAVSQYFGVAAGICILLFGRLLLQLRTLLPRVDRLLLLLTLLIIPTMAAEAAGLIPPLMATSFTPIGIGLLLAGCAVYFAVRGSRPAIYFSFSFLALLIGLMLDTLGYFYPVALSSEPNLLTGIIGVQQNWSFHIGICAEALLITFAITYFIRDMQSDVQVARAEADQTRRETAAARQEFQEKYTDLAQRVGIVDAGATPDAADKEFLENADRIIAERLADETFDVAKLAEELAMSERTLRRRVRDAADMSPVEYLRRQRLERAREYLENASFQTVAEVARAVGINSPGYFSRIYREAYDQSPRDVLKSS